MLKHCMLVLAIIAALIGAPTNVSAAGNELSAAQAGPASGTTATTFTFTVTYDGRFPATSVTASVAGRTLAMSRVAGSLSSGTWSASSTLPAGTWPVTFAAVPERGNSASLAGPTVTVAAVTPPPAATPTPAPKATPAPVPAPVPTSVPTPEVPPGGSTGLPVTPPPTAPRDSASADDDDTISPGNDDAIPAPGASDRGSPDDEGADDLEGAPAATRQVSPSMEAAPAAGPTALESSESAIPTTDGLLSIVLLVGLTGVAAVALIGVAMMLAARPREGEDEAAIPAAARFATRATMPSPDTTPNAVSAGGMLRQSRVRMTDDPIVAALGIGNDDDDRRRARRKAGQVGRGPGERPNLSRS